MIRKLLVANRGEIARRIFFTCETMGIRTVAVFSDADRQMPFVAAAEEAFALGGETPAESYLRIDSLLEAARITGADAVHPGYGFLAENADFARAVIDAGLTWVGPSPDAIETMGSKLRSKRLADELGIPTLTTHEVTAGQTPEKLQYPQLVKASAGGGGKGMRIVNDPGDLDEALESARREAASAFGDDTIFLEPYLEAPRHIEIQVFGDSHGHQVALFERECSIQRRHQKIIEEAPSPVLTEETREAMSRAAVKIAEAISYTGAGTVEFLYQDGDFYFLEMNTRLQVEHPVTEAITSLDLVSLQLRVAAGEALPGEALQPVRLGHAIEARLYAEDPRQGFLPVSGRFDAFGFPGFERVDTDLEDGVVVSPFYDPMLAKVVSWGETREEAAAKLAFTLERARLHGPVTNRELLVRILRHPEFLSGQIDTHFLERHDSVALSGPLPPLEEARLAAVAAALGAQAERRQEAGVQAAAPSGWRNSPSQLQETTFREDRAELSVGYRFEPRGRISVEVDGVTLEGAGVVSLAPDRVGLLHGAHLRWFYLHRVGNTHHVDGPSGYVRLEELPRFPPTERPEEAGMLHAPMPGRVVKVVVDVGDSVETGQALVVLEAMKMEHTLRSPHRGKVTSVEVDAGDQVETGQTLVVVEASV
ncbi:MAG TPA: biotin carboxylase N-terminal domain-containing protein [Acidimicrobiia bacterium]|nr:biotin carboxylase N-terminal domain-containing protein [Acidimicrobiia bacterium]